MQTTWKFQANPKPVAQVLTACKNLQKKQNWHCSQEECLRCERKRIQRRVTVELIMSFFERIFLVCNELADALLSICANRSRPVVSRLRERSIVRLLHNARFLHREEALKAHTQTIIPSFTRSKEADVRLMDAKRCNYSRNREYDARPGPSVFVLLLAGRPSQNKNINKIALRGIRDGRISVARIRNIVMVR